MFVFIFRCVGRVRAMSVDGTCTKVSHGRLNSSHSSFLCDIDEHAALKMTKEGTPTASFKELSIAEKQAKIQSNYETIEVLRSRLEESQKREKAGMTRAAYIKMIFDATKKVDKQNQELARAVLDIRQLQRDIRSLNGWLDQSFKLAEETIRQVSILDFKLSVSMSAKQLI